MANNDDELVSIKISKVFPAKKWKVLRLITRLDHFPRYMPNVKECRVLERGPKSAVTFWRVMVDQFPISWKERDEFDLAGFCVHFKSIEGDLEHFEGKWMLTDHPSGGTEVTVEASAKIGIPGIPLVTDLMGNVVQNLLEKNFNHILNAFDQMLTRSRYKNIRDRRVSDLGGFAVVGHPYNFQHLVRYFKFFKPDLKLPSREFISRLFDITPAYKAYDVKGFKSKTGQLVDGYFVMCPIIPDMVTFSPQQVLEKVIQGCHVAEKLGVGIVALGGFTSIAGDTFEIFIETNSSSLFAIGSSSGYTCCEPG